MTAAHWKLPDGFDRRTTPARSDLAASALRGIVAAARYTDGRRMRIGREAEPLRAEPDAVATCDTQALFGEEVLVLDENDGWAWVQLLRDEYVGYLRSSSLTQGRAPITHRICAPRTFVYPSANMKAQPVMALPMGAQVAAARSDGAFCEAPELGFIWSAHLAAHDAVESDFVAVARRFLFAPYLWGGKTSMGLDCSGLIQIALQACGVRCPRDSDMIGREIGAAVDPDEAIAHPRRGDLIFWKGHVGTIGEGDTLLHANGFHMQVTEEPLVRAVARIRDNSFGRVTGVRRLQGFSLHRE